MSNYLSGLLLGFTIYLAAEKWVFKRSLLDDFTFGFGAGLLSATSLAVLYLR